MAYKVFTSDELAQKFLDNAQTHILSDSVKNRLTLGNIKTAIENGWGFDMSESNKCVCCDYEHMDEYGEWGRSGKVNMRNFWIQVFGASSLMSITNPSTHTVNSQISLPVDNMLLSEERVSIKGCCAKIYEALSGKTITVANTGVTSDTEMQINFYPVIRNTATAATPSLIIKTLGRYTFSGATSPNVITYFDVNADDTTNIKWNVTSILKYPVDTILNNPADSYLKFNDTTYVASLNGSVGSSQTSFKAVIENKSINDIANINSIGFSTSMSEPPSDCIVDIKSCKIPCYPSYMDISGATYQNNANVVCYFSDSLIYAWGAVNANDSTVMKVNATLNYSSTGTLQLVFDPSTFGPLNGSEGELYMWVGLPIRVGSFYKTAYFCFYVYYMESFLRLEDNECYLNMASFYNDGGQKIYITVNGGGHVLARNPSGNYVMLVSNGGSWSGDLYTYDDGLICSTLEIQTPLGQHVWQYKEYTTSSPVTIKTIPSTSAYYTQVPLIHASYTSTLNDLVIALYNRNLSYAINRS